jgi:DNA-binding LacI/PurR family transcriptional regulator
MRETIFRRIASQLQSQIEKGELKSFPSAYELARRLAVSPVTALKVLHVLAEKGVIRVSQGRRPEIIVQGREARPSAAIAEDRFCTEIQAQLLDGTLEWRSPLPKLQYLSAAHHLSKDAVCCALRRLAGENLVHKSGKKWIAGPESAQQSRNVIAAHLKGGPAVLIVAASIAEARNFFSVTHTAPFAYSLRSELTKYGFSHVMVTQMKTESAGRLFAGGIDETYDLVRSLADRYAGALIVCSALPHEPEEWIAALARFGKPVVYFDAANRTGPDLMKALGPRGKGMRLWFDEPTAVRSAVDHLMSHGHRRIGAFDPEPHVRESHTTRRINLIREAIRGAGRGAVLVSALQDDPIWVPQTERTEFASPFGDIEIATEQKAKPSPGPILARSSFARLVEKSPTFLSVLRQKVTAILAINDLAAIDYYLWFNAAGIAVPKDISLMGFDNLPEVHILQLSTIDFGFQQLGYLAAHIMIGDIPVRPDAQGNIPGKITLIDKGSVRQPPKISLAARLGL